MNHVYYILSTIVFNSFTLARTVAIDGLGLDAAIGIVPEGVIACDDVIGRVEGIIVPPLGIGGIVDIEDIGGIDGTEGIDGIEGIGRVDDIIVLPLDIGGVGIS
jgi:hypothetical protein